MKYVILNDLHFGCRNGSDIFIEYQRSFFEYLLKYMEDENIGHILILGDVFDKRRTIDFKVLNFVNEIFDKIRQQGIGVTITLGNHDVYYKDTNKLNSPNLLLEKRFNVNVIDSCQTLHGHSDIGLVPWIPSKDNDKFMSFIKDNTFKTLLGHFEISGFVMYKDGIKLEHGLKSSLFTHHENTYSGHYHHKSSVGSIHYLGSQFQFTWSDANDQKYFHILDTNTHDMVPAKVPFEMFTNIKGILPKHLYSLENKYVRFHSDVDLPDYVLDELKNITHGFEQIIPKKKVLTKSKEETSVITSKAKLIQSYSKDNGLDDFGIAKFLDIYSKANS